jgi:hypothetical protein
LSAKKRPRRRATLIAKRRCSSWRSSGAIGQGGADGLKEEKSGKAKGPQTNRPAVNRAAAFSSQDHNARSISALLGPLGFASPGQHEGRHIPSRATRERPHKRRSATWAPVVACGLAPPIQSRFLGSCPSRDSAMREGPANA